MVQQKHLFAHLFMNFNLLIILTAHSLPDLSKEISKMYNLSVPVKVELFLENTS